MKKLLILVFGLCLSTSIFSQSVTGQLIDKNTGEPLIGATVTVQGTTVGTITDVDGNFTIAAPSNSTLIFSYVGYDEMMMNVGSGASSLGSLGMGISTNSLDEVVISGIIDIAKERETPVAVSTIRAAEIIDRIGNQELPELLNSTPSVYATKSGGGFGDSRINIRGFDQVNTAVMINGVPVNDMENGRVFWSNWAGLSDVTTAMQVQRGLGSSKLAISSVGGTINVLTKATANSRGGNASVTVGNDGYLKTLLSYNTGRSESGFGSSFLLSRTAGDGYVTGTKFEGYNYFVALGYANGRNDLQFTVTGAPQVHNQRTTSFFNMATLGDYITHGTKYNYNHGEYNGEEFNWRRNFYHKPIASLNWEFEVNEKSKLSTVFYASYGRGGGTGDIGRLGGNFASSSKFRNENGEVLWDAIAASNGGTNTEFSGEFNYNNEIDPYTSTFIVNDDEIRSDDLGDQSVARRNGAIRRASINSHNWLGVVTNFNTALNEVLTFDVGFDLRSYKGIHYRRVDNLLGADGYRDNDNINAPYNVITQEVESNLSGLWNVFKSTDDDQKLNYYNDGLVGWQGVFTQLEYSEDALSAFVQAAGSNQSYQRVDYFSYLDTDENQTSEKVSQLGGNIKGGLNYNLDENNNVFINGGFYSKQPLFDAVFLNFRNDINPDIRNEKIVGLELGYGYRASNFKANVNLYRTSWSDRFVTLSSDFDVNGTPQNEDDDVEGFANANGVEQVHMGLEIDAIYNVSEMFGLTGMLSVGNWEYGGNVDLDFFDDNQTKVGEGALFLDGVKVGDAAQLTARLGVEVEPVDGLSFDIAARHAGNLYASINAEDFDREDNEGSLQLPSYNLVDLGLSYRLKVTDLNFLNLRFNINNLFDTEYIAESRTNIFAGEGDEVFDGINTRNKVFFGFGRTWNASARINF